MPIRNQRAKAKKKEKKNLITFNKNILLLELEKWKIENPGVPFGSLKLEPGKEYVGKEIYKLEIRTINGYLWILPFEFNW